MAKGCASFLSGQSHQLTRSLERILEDAHVSGELKLSGRKLKDFPKTGGKYDLSDTVTADLSKNRFWDLPIEVTEFTSLERLELYHNTIRSIPENVVYLQSLVHLDLSRNQLNVLPSAVCTLPLQVLLLGNNKLVNLPEDIGRLQDLTLLDVSCNLLSTLPPQIGELAELRDLNASNNVLCEVPLELTYLRLERLDISGNRISSLPVELRSMTTLVYLNLNHNPLTSPPAKLCARGRVHVFKYLETQALSNVNKHRNDEWRRTHRKLSDPRGNLRHNKRYTVDSGYSTSDNWSQEVLTGIGEERLGKRSPLMTRQINGNGTVPRTSANGSGSGSASSTPSTGSPSEVTEEDVTKEPLEKKRLERSQSDRSDARRFEKSNTSKFSPDSPSEAPVNGNGLVEEKRPLEHIQTYREYKEALRNQRAQEGASVYKPRVSGELTPPSPDGAPLSLQPSPVHNGHSKDESAVDSPNGSVLSPSQVDGVPNISKKPVQKVPPSRNLNFPSALSNGNSVNANNSTSNGGGDSPVNSYTKPVSPTSSVGVVNGVPNSNISPGRSIPRLVTTSVGYVSPAPNRNKAGGRSVRWGRDVPPDKLSFTMRREFEKAKEEAELIKQLRTQIEARLKMVLPEDMAPALADGVVLCHLANHVRPRSVASIHVPSPAVPKLTMARCRRNVDNFLDACRKIGVEEEVLCSSEGVVLGSEEGLYSLALTVLRLLDIATSDSNGPSDEDTCSEDDILNDKSVKEETVSSIHPPLPRHPHDKAISTFCAILFITTVVLLYFFPPPS
ncbi:leucine-rich repeat and calponin homology domain-containing protein isoform X2 [Thrips palmi]|uniref:Leucine-rich repeat and calponin homology domain-containing protein isoform X2 n=1 Tax=Thrips palmi TaxID=161013 RepID=A0A6P8XWY5_THRPL|nr:leucine-rich repeat and calponin homology domain-containing protein isoform X2 [Thrips palmi]